MPDFTQFINLGGFLGLLAFIAYSIYMDWRAGRFGVNIPTNAIISSKMDSLSLHYNHETTDLLERIVDGQNDLKDCIKKANFTLSEIKEYGVKIRS